MPDPPTIAHVTLTVSDLDRRVRWYERLFDVEFHRDESPGPFRRAVWLVEGQTLVGLHEFPDPPDTHPFDERRIGLDHRHSLVRTGMNSRRGKPGSQNWASAMGGSSMLTTALRSLAVIRTTLRWNSSLRPSRAGLLCPGEVGTLGPDRYRHFPSRERHGRSS